MKHSFSRILYIFMFFTRYFFKEKKASAVFFITNYVTELNKTYKNFNIMNIRQRSDAEVLVRKLRQLTPLS